MKHLIIVAVNALWAGLLAFLLGGLLTIMWGQAQGLICGGFIFFGSWLLLLIASWEWVDEHEVKHGP